ncbi:hypothetical protein CYK37_21790 [Mesorhizobium loti]|nr:hypothetical protein CYK37_21790 [Mesorhizobium loti]
MASPLEQFEIKPIVIFGEIAGQEIAFTNSAAHMVAATLLGGLFLLGATLRRELVPSRLQSSAELIYDFVAKTLRDNAGEAGMRFFPLVFSLFMFVLMANLLGMLPFAFTVTSHMVPRYLCRRHTGRLHHAAHRCRP